MKKHLFISFAFIGSFGHAQSVDSTDATIQLSIYNPTDKPLTLILENRLIVNGLKPIRAIFLAANDTTAFPFEIIIAENRVPRNDYEFRIYEAPYYRDVDYHSKWHCKRVEENVEYYTCLHSIYEHIEIADSLHFDSLSFFKALYEQYPVYQTTEVDSLAKPMMGELEFMRQATSLIAAEGPSANVSIYAQLQVELDGSVSSVEILKTSDDQYDQMITEFFHDILFIPGYQGNLKVRSKVVFPIIVGVKG